MTTAQLQRTALHISELISEGANQEKQAQAWRFTQEVSRRQRLSAEEAFSLYHAVLSGEQEMTRQVP